MEREEDGEEDGDKYQVTKIWRQEKKREEEEDRDKYKVRKIW